jgi:hypothetical protein
MKNKYSAEKQLQPLVAQTDAKIREKTDLESRRDFIKKYGALAAITPVAMTLTLHSKKALASSCTECGP